MTEKLHKTAAAQELENTLVRAQLNAAEETLKPVGGGNGDKASMERLKKILGITVRKNP